MSVKVNPNDCSNCKFKSLFFDSLKHKGFELINSCKEQYEFKKGEIICREGDMIESLIFLNSGLIKIHKQVSKHKSQILRIAKPMSFIGLLSVFSKERFYFSVTAIENSSVCYIRKSCIVHEITNNGNFALDIIGKMSKAADEVFELNFDLRNKRLRGRIAHILLDFSENIYKNTSFELPVSRNEIAELIGMSTENVIRIFSEFRNDKIIKTNGHIIEIIDPVMLKKISYSG